MLQKQAPSAHRLEKELQDRVEVIDGSPTFDSKNPVSRAVARLILPGDNVQCVCCGEVTKFESMDRGKPKIVANIYEQGVWQGVEHYFPPSCYAEAGAPYGPVYTNSVQEGIEDYDYAPNQVGSAVSQ